MVQYGFNSGAIRVLWFNWLTVVMSLLVVKILTNICVTDFAEFHVKKCIFDRKCLFVTVIIMATICL